MKSISRQIFGALLGLYVASLTVRCAVADEMADWMAEMRRQNDEFNRQAQQQREDMDRFNREAQEMRDFMDKLNREAQKERDAWYEWNRQVQQWRDDERKQQEWDEWRNRLTGDAEAAAPAAESVTVAAKVTVPESKAPKSALPKSTLPKTLLVRPAGARQFWFPARSVTQQPLVIVNPFVSQSQSSQNQQPAGQQIIPTRQQMTPWRGEFSQVIENPFVRSAP